jgi:hypothetical protein
VPNVHELSKGKSFIAIQSGDHNPPHFHIYTPEGAAKVRIDTLEILAGSVDGGVLKEAREWAAANRVLLNRKWIEQNERG